MKILPRKTGILMPLLDKIIMNKYIFGLAPTRKTIPFPINF